MRNKTGSLLLLALQMAAVGCGGTTTPTDGGITADVPVVTDTPVVIRPDAPMVVGDGNDSFAEAEPLTLNAAALAAELNPPTDVDYYSFEGTEGTFVGIFTATRVAMDDTAMGVIDTVITLYDSSMTQIAENDDALPRINTDSAIYTRLPATGTYYIRVEDFNVWMPDMPQGDRTDLDYTISVGLLNGAAVSNDAGDNDTVATAQALTLTAAMTGTQRFTFIAGTAESATDVDVYSFSVTAGQNTNFFVQPAGAAASGSTGIPARMWITNAAGDEIIARVTTSNSPELAPALPVGDYLLWIDPPAAALGSNPFYYLTMRVDGQDNPAEAADATNGVIETPEALTMMASATARQGFILATLGPSDVDFYSFDVAAAGQVVSVTCGSRTNGSGVVGLSIALQTAAGVAVTGGSATETATTDAGFNAVPVSAAGTYVLRLSATSQDAEVTGNWVRCGIYVAAPTP